MTKGRIKNEEIWQQLREEIIHVLLQNSDIISEEEIVSYFKKYYSHYNIELADIEIITKDSKYINQLLKKNASYTVEFKNRLKVKFNEILADQIVEIENASIEFGKEDTEKLDKEIAVALQYLFERVLDNKDVLDSMMKVDKDYQDLVKELSNK